MDTTLLNEAKNQLSEKDYQYFCTHTLLNFSNANKEEFDNSKTLRKFFNKSGTMLLESLGFNT